MVKGNQRVAGRAPGGGGGNEGELLLPGFVKLALPLCCFFCFSTIFLPPARGQGAALTLPRYFAALSPWIIKVFGKTTQQNKPRSFLSPALIPANTVRTTATKSSQARERKRASELSQLSPRLLNAADQLFKSSPPKGRLSSWGAASSPLPASVLRASLPPLALLAPPSALPISSSTPPPFGRS